MFVSRKKIGWTKKKKEKEKDTKNWKKISKWNPKKIQIMTKLKENTRLEGQNFFPFFSFVSSESRE